MGSLCHFGHLTKRTQAPGPNLSAHHLLLDVPTFALASLSLSLLLLLNGWGN